jgi:hypothetical protein
MKYKDQPPNDELATHCVANLQTLTTKALAVPNSFSTNLPCTHQ